jgi:hypothetical protein
MTNLRKLARGQDCKVRLAGICNFDPQTTVLAHIREGFYGMGIKPPDVCGVHACSSCHDEIDRRTRKMDQPEVDRAVLRALCEQLRWYVERGVIKA